jgi:poly-gamma-glutamate synthesis protein (capsule biosynthesis protein)
MGPDSARILVLAFAVLFLVGAVAFLARAFDALDADRPSPSPVPVSSVTGAAASPADRVVTLAQPSEPTGAPASVDPLPSASPAASIDPCLDHTLPLGASASAPPASSPSPGAAAAAGPAAAGVPSAAPGASLPVSPASPDPCASVDPATASDPVVRSMPFVPVVRFWATRETVSRHALVQALRGRATGWDRVLIPSGDREALATALDITIPGSVRETTPGAIIAAVKRGDTLGVLRASDVVPSVRALGIDGRHLFGNDRLEGLGRWPLVAQVPVAGEDVWRQADTWTLVAGGDSFTDRGIYERVEARGKGVDYPFDGGRARVTGHRICPSCPRAEGNLVPIYRLSGPKGIVRAIVRDADLAIANHEQPTPVNWTYHLQGLTFSGKPDLTRIFTRAGIDFMSLANNHIRDYADAGVINTLKTLDEHGIRHAGAGRNLRQAAKPAYLRVKGLTVGIVACNQFSVPRNRATETRAGALTCKSDEAFAAVRAARKRADVLIVFPHWGVEYTRVRKAYQEKLADRWARMGVDLVVGAHSHVPGGIGDVAGMPVFYSLGNFIFDQTWSTPTMEGILGEMTFEGDRLVQIRLHPFLTHDQAQPNLLDPRHDDGEALMTEIRKASKRISDW